MQYLYLPGTLTFRGLFLWFIAALVSAGILEGFGIGSEILFAVMTFLLLSAVGVVNQRRNNWFFLACIATTVTANILAYVTTSWVIDVCSITLSLFVFSYASWLIFIKVFSGHRVDSDTIFGAVSVYLMIGIDCAIAFQLTSLVDRNAFAFMPGAGVLSELPVVENFLHTYVYFSFVTLTSTGYGDITPLSAPARYIAIIEAITGHIYLSVLVARLVGLHLSVPRTETSR